MKKLLAVVLGAVLAGSLFCSAAFALPVRADGKAGDQFLADLQDSLNCMYLIDETVGEDEIVWANEDADYTELMGSYDNELDLLYDMVKDYAELEFDDARLTLLKDLYISGLKQMLTAVQCEENDAFYITQYTAGLLSYQQAQNALSDEYDVKILQDDYDLGNELQDVILDFWSNYDTEGLKEVIIDDNKLMVPDYYMLIPSEDGETVMMYASGDDLALAVVGSEPISADEYDEFVSTLAEADEASIAEEMGLDDPDALTGITELLSDDHSTVVRIDVAQEMEIYNGISVQNNCIYIAANRESEQALLFYMGYSGDSRFADDFDAAVMSNFNREDTEEVSDGGDETKEQNPIEADVPEGVSPEVKALLDDYEAFIDEFVEFAKTADTEDPSALLDYFAMIGRFGEFEEKMEKLQNMELSPEEEAYMQEVIERIEKKVNELDL